MNRYVHSESGLPIEGMQLAAGTTIQSMDHYASSDGTWRPAPCCGGMVIQQGCKTVWVRPGASLSHNGRELLSYLHRNGYFLTERFSGYWVALPSIRSKNNANLYWRITHPECIKELIEYGFVVPTTDDNTVFELTERGRMTARNPAR